MLNLSHGWPGKSGLGYHARCSRQAELCAFLRINRATLYRLIKAGEIPWFRVGSDYRFNREEIDPK